jgi:hypothetical protein
VEREEEGKRNKGGRKMQGEKQKVEKKEDIMDISLFFLTKQARKK